MLRLNGSKSRAVTYVQVPSGRPGRRESATRLATRPVLTICSIIMLVYFFPCLRRMIYYTIKKHAVQFALLLTYNILRQREDYIYIVYIVPDSLHTKTEVG